MLADKAVPPAGSHVRRHSRAEYVRRRRATRRPSSCPLAGQGENWKWAPSLWDVAEGALPQIYNWHTVPTCVAVLPDGRVLMGSSCMSMFGFYNKSSLTICIREF